MRQVLMVISMGPGGNYFWQAAGQENELIDRPNRRALVSLKCHNPTNYPLRMQVVRTETGAIEFENNMLAFPEWRHFEPPIEKPQLPEPEFELDEIHQACEYLQSTKSPG